MPKAKYPIQVFEGVTFYRKPPGYYKACHKKFGEAVYMHRFVWEFYNGQIPPGSHIHHIDHDRSNNAIGNLQCKTAAEHLSEHGFERSSNPDELKKMREVMDRVRVFASAWHGSEDGKLWHQQHARDVWEQQSKSALICSHCQGNYDGYKSWVKQGFCSASCQGMARKASGVDNEARQCGVCDAEFQTNKYQRVKTCGKACWKEAISRSRLARI